MPAFDPNRYAEVKDRIVEFLSEFPEGTIQTFIALKEGPEIIFEARIFKTRQDVIERVYTSGFAREVEGSGSVQRTSHVEVGETSAVGRALANAGYLASSERPSREEMLKNERVKKEHAAMIEFIRAVGPKIGDDKTFELEGETHGLKSWARENWEDVEARFSTARMIVDLFEEASGKKLSDAAA